MSKLNPHRHIVEMQAVIDRIHARVDEVEEPLAHLSKIAAANRPIDFANLTDGQVRAVYWSLALTDLERMKRSRLTELGLKHLEPSRN